jgi:ATP-binding protein involved in chromosome partitioning
MKLTENPECETCADKSENCEETCDRHDFSFAPQKGIRSVIAVMSGKGGVGKSTVTALLATAMAKKGYQSGILDADITGPSIPRLFGLRGNWRQTGLHGLMPVETTLGIRVMSLNLLMDNDDEAVIWRGPLLVGAVKQFWEEVDWGDLDYLFVDLPPGTGDVPLTVLQSLPLKGVIVVTSPQDLAVMIVKKAIRMTKKLDVPIIGLVENMAYHECLKCGDVSYPFGQPQGEDVGTVMGLPLLATIPINQAITSFGDRGQVEMLDESPLSGAVARLEQLQAGV